MVRCHQAAQKLQAELAAVSMDGEYQIHPGIGIDIEQLRPVRQQDLIAIRLIQEFINCLPGERFGVSKQIIFPEAGGASMPSVLAYVGSFSIFSISRIIRILPLAVKYITPLLRVPLWYALILQHRNYGIKNRFRKLDCLYSLY